MSEATDSAVEAKEKSQAVALIIAILALLLALAEAGAKNAQHRSTEDNIESSDLFNFYQAKRIRSTVAETAAAMLEAQKSAVSDPKAQDAFEKQIADFKATVARYEKDPEDFRRQPRQDPGSRQRGGRATRTGQSAPRTLRARKRPRSDRDRAGVRGDHHRDYRPRLVQRGARRDRRGAGRFRVSRPDIVAAGGLSEGIALKAANARSLVRRSRWPAR